MFQGVRKIWTVPARLCDILYVYFQAFQSHLLIYTLYLEKRIVGKNPPGKNPPIGKVGKNPPAKKFLENDFFEINFSLYHSVDNSKTLCERISKYKKFDILGFSLIIL